MDDYIPAICSVRCDCWSVDYKSSGQKNPRAKPCDTALPCISSVYIIDRSTNEEEDYFPHTKIKMFNSSSAAYHFHHPSRSHYFISCSFFYVLVFIFFFLFFWGGGGRAVH